MLVQGINDLTGKDNSEKISVIAKYEPHTSQREYNLYEQEYFCGTDTYLMINGTKIDQAVSIQYSVMEQQKPLYGYASRTFNSLAIGNRIIVGTLRVAIGNKEDNDISKFKVDAEKGDGSYFYELTEKVVSTKSIDVSYGNGPSSAIQGYVGENTVSTPNPLASATPPVWVSNTQDALNSVKIKIYTKTPVISEIEAVQDSSSNISIHNPKIVKLQIALIALGYDISVNGMEDDLKTESAIVAYKTSKGIYPADSTVDSVITNDFNLNNVVDTNINTVRSAYVTTLNNNSPVYLLLSPSDNAPSCSEQLQTNTQLNILATVDEFYKVSLSNGKIGYVRKSYVTLGGVQVE